MKYIRTKEADIQIHLRGALGDAFGNNISRHEVAMLAVEVFHEIDAPAIAHIVQAPAFATCSLGYQHALVGSLERGGVELDELQVA